MRGRNREAEPFKVSSSTKSHACPDIYVIFCCASQPLYELAAGKLSSSQVERSRENLADFEQGLGSRASSSWFPWRSVCYCHELQSRGSLLGSRYTIIALTSRRYSLPFRPYGLYSSGLAMLSTLYGSSMPSLNLVQSPL